VRFSWLMLGREPRSEKELLMVYAGILAESSQGSSFVSTARLLGTRDTEADLRGELGFQPGAKVLGPMGPFARLGPNAP
jgi:hypothetical protein